MRRPHEVPLSRQAIAVLRDIWPVSEMGDLIFPSTRSFRRPLSDNAFNSALRRMGYTQEEMTAHGFRSTASTILNENGFNPDVIEAALGHQEENSIRRAYNRATYWRERVGAHAEVGRHARPIPHARPRAAVQSPSGKTDKSIRPLQRAGTTSDAAHHLNATQVAYQVAETVSATSGRKQTDSAPVRVRYRARPNSFSSAYRTSASHLLRLTDVAAGKPIGSGALTSATTNWRGRFQPFLTASRRFPRPALQYPQAALRSRSHARNGGPP